MGFKHAEKKVDNLYVPKNMFWLSLFQRFWLHTGFSGTCYDIKSEQDIFVCFTKYGVQGKLSEKVKKKSNVKIITEIVMPSKSDPK